MTNEDLRSQSTDQLRSRLTTMRTATGILMGMLTILIIASVYGLLTGKVEFIAILIIAIGTASVLPMLFTGMKRLEGELNSRK